MQNLQLRSTLHILTHLDFENRKRYRRIRNIEDQAIVTVCDPNKVTGDLPRAHDKINITLFFSMRPIQSSLFNKLYWWWECINNYLSGRYIGRPVLLCILWRLCRLSLYRIADITERVSGSAWAENSSNSEIFRIRIVLGSGYYLDRFLLSPVHDYETLFARSRD